ncbi:MAG: hypothetical protein GXO48_05220, partial [Chlorobi bacterium]|nr:hypothetical protein [Chlorobiota bacterium]
MNRIVRETINGLVVGFVLLLNVSSVFSQNVGVGTTTPQAHFHVSGTYGTTVPLLQVDIDSLTIPFLVISSDGKVGIRIANPSEPLDISGNVQFSGALMPGGNAGTSGQVLVSQGPGIAPQWQDASSVGGDNWGNQVAQTQNPVVGDGTASNPITFASGTAVGQVWKWNGSQWVLGKDSVGDNWGSQVAQTQSPVVGDGTSSNPIAFASGTAVGQVWKWDGSQWVLGKDSVGDNWG